MSNLRSIEHGRARTFVLEHGKDDMKHLVGNMAEGDGVMLSARSLPSPSTHLTREPWGSGGRKGTTVPVRAFTCEWGTETLCLMRPTCAGQ